MKASPENPDFQTTSSYHNMLHRLHIILLNRVNWKDMIEFQETQAVFWKGEIVITGDSNDKSISRANVS